MKVAPPGLSSPPAQREVDPQLRKAAEGMETMFVDYLMKVMRQTVPKNDMDLESSATEIYRGMLDSEYAEQAVRSRGVGLADQIIAYLQRESYTGIQAGSAGTGIALKPPVEGEKKP